ncbi:DUF4389 domain-containing protein [Simiduia sp. 21SJ11W-1]|uniref:DUF4389 domain-containing protein n=1 Tax=Simiduia sp. 21SJ11W-1 TaxID=2909669 RepID=UPI00209EECF3|nr:DUF4389 domain-containing protein [Simiduia sp. 21SJ11W-1]UTA46949.1 DUF4389 domain-containing protein [Simiduia sp. 21SJ11W-1]
MSQAQENPTWNNLTNQDTWFRLIYMLIYGIMLHFAGVAMWILCGVQFIFTLIFGEDNKNVRDMCATLRNYIHEALAFVSYNSEHKPFPFNGQNAATSQAADTQANHTAERSGSEVIDAEAVKETTAEPETHTNAPRSESSEAASSKEAPKPDADFDNTDKKPE